MDQLEQENRELREEVTTLKDTMERLSLMVETLTVAQNRSSTLFQRTVISEIISSPIVGVPVNAPQYQMPPNRPWGMPINFIPEGYVPPVTEDQRAIIPEGYRPQDVEGQGTSVGIFFPGGYRPQDAEEPRNAAVMSIPPPVMHVNPHAEQNCHAALSEGMGVYERMDEVQDKFLEMQKELRAIRGQDLFGKEAADLCLVPNVKIPHKFKVPSFEKYKGDTCPQSHLTMYARKMST